MLANILNKKSTISPEKTIGCLQLYCNPISAVTRKPWASISEMSRCVAPPSASSASTRSSAIGRAAAIDLPAVNRSANVGICEQNSLNYVAMSSLEKQARLFSWRLLQGAPARALQKKQMKRTRCPGRPRRPPPRPAQGPSGPRPRRR